jgi:hypothetical protein
MNSSSGGAAMRSISKTGESGILSNEFDRMAAPVKADSVTGIALTLDRGGW